MVIVWTTHRRKPWPGQIRRVETPSCCLPTRKFFGCEKRTRTKKRRTELHGEGRRYVEHMFITKENTRHAQRVFGVNGEPLPLRPCAIKMGHRSSIDICIWHGLERERGETHRSPCLFNGQAKIKPHTVIVVPRVIERVRRSSVGDNSGLSFPAGRHLHIIGLGEDDQECGLRPFGEDRRPVKKHRGGHNIWTGWRRRETRAD